MRVLSRIPAAVVPCAAAVVLCASPVTAVAQRAGTAPAAQQAPTKAAIVAAARDVMQRARYATFTTVDANGQPQSRVVDPLVPDAALVVWIGTNPATRKVAEVRARPRVSLLYFDATGLEYAMVTGTATIVTDRAEKAKHWKAEWAPFYPKRAEDPGYVLIRVVPSRVEVVSPRHSLMNDPKDWRPVGVNLP
ncbi:MAG: pyridoxamine 5'-phosphate oxidase family protein [Gemmatimonadota bacterium]|nr:pyridoxamine 5'-phosphate oxidase family protein [Gemmatimonadota bacterium]